MALVRFNTPYQGYDPSTIYAANDATKTLSPISSDAVYTGAGYQNGQEQVADPSQYSAYQIGAPITRADQLSAIKDQLNSYQTQLYGQPEPANQRQSSSIADSINSSQDNYNTYLKEYNDLQTKLNQLNAPNYQDTYNQLRQAQGIPGFEQDYLNTRQNERTLPYTNRAASGNAGVETEAQLGNDTSQKLIPLGIQEQNVLDRLNLANSFVNNSLNFKQMDYNAAHQSLTDAINTTAQAIDLSHTHFNDLLNQQQQQNSMEQAAKQFALENRVASPFYTIDGKTVYNTTTGKGISSPQEYVAQGGKGDFSDVQKVQLPLSKIFTKIGSHTDADGNIIDDYGFVNPITNEVAPTSNPNNSSGGSGGSYAAAPGSTLVSKNPTKVVNGYDLTTYATDPNYGVKVNTVVSGLGQINTAQDAQNAINRLAKNSPVTGAMVMAAAKQYGVDPAVMLGIMKVDSQLGTAGKGARTYNPGNVGNTDSGATKDWGSWQAGVDAVASNLSRRKLASTGSQSSGADATQKYYGIGKKTYDAVAPLVDKFGSEQTVQNYQAAADALKTANGITNVNDSAQSQALLFAFAKALNPASSMTRQGMIDTLSQNSGSILQQFGVDVSRILNNQSTISPEAVGNIQSEIKQLYSQYKNGYDNVYSQYAKRIDGVAGVSGIGKQILTDYSNQPGIDPAKDYANSLLNMTPEEQYASYIHQELNGGPMGNVGFTTSTPLDINQARQSGGLTF